jgi:hypothetical protein
MIVERARWRGFSPARVYREEPASNPRDERMFIGSVAFFGGFGAARAVTHAIRRGVGPFRNLAVGGRHLLPVMHSHVDALRPTCTLPGRARRTAREEVRRLLGSYATGRDVAAQTHGPSGNVARRKPQLCSGGPTSAHTDPRHRDTRPPR